MNYTKEQLINALMGEFYKLIEDGYEEEIGMSEEDYQKHLHTLTMEQLIEETWCDDEELTLDDFINTYSF